MVSPLAGDFDVFRMASHRMISGNVSGDESMTEFQNVTVVIPSLDPDERLPEVIRGVREQGFTDILLVDDGSAPENQHYFDEAEQTGCTVIRHSQNFGKGRALKTAFAWILKNRPEGKGCVTIDGDGQHAKEDIAACVKKMLTQEKDSLVLGVRDFDAANVPPKSRYGNKCTSFIFRLFCGLRVTDTQTGLRVFPQSILPAMLEITGERFEYETNMLLSCRSRSIPIVEQKIQTIYIDENKASHFHPILDSLRIYGIIIRFCCSSVLSFLVDFGLFNLLYYLCRKSKHRLLFSVIPARIISSLLNFLVNRNAVFHHKEPIAAVTVKYYILCIAQMLVSYFSVKGLSALFGKGALLVAVMKLIVDCVLYFLSFRIQQDWVFRQKPHHAERSHT